MFWGPSRLMLPFGWVQKQNNTKVPSKGCPSGVGTLPGPTWKLWATEMKAEVGHKPSLCLLCSSHPPVMDTICS